MQRLPKMKVRYPQMYFSQSGHFFLWFFKGFRWTYLRSMKKDFITANGGFYKKKLIFQGDSVQKILASHFELFSCFQSWTTRIIGLGLLGTQKTAATRHVQFSMLCAIRNGFLTWLWKKIVKNHWQKLLIIVQPWANDTFWYANTYWGWWKVWTQTIN